MALNTLDRGIVLIDRCEAREIQLPASVDRWVGIRDDGKRVGFLYDTPEGDHRAGIFDSDLTEIYSAHAVPSTPAGMNATGSILAHTTHCRPNVRCLSIFREGTGVVAVTLVQRRRYSLLSTAPNAERVFLADSDRVWRWESGDSLETVSSPGGYPSRIFANHDGTRVLFERRRSEGPLNPDARILDVETKELGEPLIEAGTGGSVRSVDRQHRFALVLGGYEGPNLSAAFVLGLSNGERHDLDPKVPTPRDQQVVDGRMSGNGAWLALAVGSLPYSSAKELELLLVRNPVDPAAR